jgi:hypothetical protein
MFHFNAKLEGEFHQLVVDKAQLCNNGSTTKQQNLETLSYLNKSISLATKSTAKRDVKIADLKKLKKNLQDKRKIQNSNQFFSKSMSDHLFIKKHKQELPDSSLPIKKRKIVNGQSKNVTASNVEAIMKDESQQQARSLSLAS